MTRARDLCRSSFTHFVNGQLEEAIDGYRQAIAVDDRLPLAWNGLSKALERSGDLDGALEAARRLAELEPDDPLSQTNLSQLYQRKGMIAEAEQAKASATRLQMRANRR